MKIFSRNDTEMNKFALSALQNKSVATKRNRFQWWTVKNVNCDDIRLKISTADNFPRSRIRIKSVDLFRKGIVLIHRRIEILLKNHKLLGSHGIFFEKCETSRQLWYGCIQKGIQP